MTDVQTPAPQASFRLIYRSHDLIPAENRRADLGDLFSEARSNNKARNITGALLVSDDWFVQTLEGEEKAVRELFSRIEADPRHDKVSVLHTSMVDQRVFQRWSMARVGEDGEPDVTLIAHKEGISRAQSRGTTSAQEEVLDVMRAATRADLVDG